MTQAKRIRNLRAANKELKQAVVNLTQARNDALDSATKYYEIAVDNRQQLNAAQDVIDSLTHKSLISRIRDWIS